MRDIERLAREAGATTVDDTDSQCWAGDLAFDSSELQRFAALVRNAVLEEAVEALRKEYMTGTKPTFLYDLEASIRALKETT